MNPQFMRRNYSKGMVLIACLALSACIDSNLQQLETQQESLSNQARTSPPGITPMAPSNVWSQVTVTDLGPYGKDVLNFVISGKAYILLSSRGEVWEYNIATGALALKGPMPFLAAYNVGAFTLGQKGYVVSGEDLHEYNPATNVWTLKSSFPGIARYNPVTFSVHGRGYLCSGTKLIPSPPLDNTCSDLWEYNATADTWTQKADIPVSRGNAMGVGTTSKGYVGCGYRKYFNILLPGVRTRYLHDWWEYYPPTNTWTQKADFPGAGRILMESFTVASLPYLGGGYDNENANKVSTPDLWRYDPATNLWLARQKFPTAFDGTFTTTFGDANNGYLVVENFAQMWKYWK